MFCKQSIATNPLKALSSLQRWTGSGFKTQSYTKQAFPPKKNQKQEEVTTQLRVGKKRRQKHTFVGVITGGRATERNPRSLFVFGLPRNELQVRSWNLVRRTNIDEHFLARLQVSRFDHKSCFRKDFHAFFVELPLLFKPPFIILPKKLQSGFPGGVILRFHRRHCCLQVQDSKVHLAGALAGCTATQLHSLQDAFRTVLQPCVTPKRR